MRSCNAGCPALGKDGRCQIDGALHFDGETGETAGCPWEKGAGNLTVLEMLETLRVCCIPNAQRCLYCPFYNTSFCKSVLTSPAMVHAHVDEAIADLTTDILPYDFFD